MPPDSTITGLRAAARSAPAPMIRMPRASAAATEASIAWALRSIVWLPAKDMTVNPASASASRRSPSASRVTLPLAPRKPGKSCRVPSLVSGISS